MAKALLCLLGFILMSPLTSWDTKVSKTAWVSGFFIYTWKLLANANLSKLKSRLISFLKTLKVYLNLKLSKNYWIKSIHKEVRGYFLSLLSKGCSYWKPICFLFWLLYLSTRLRTYVLSFDWTYLKSPDAWTSLKIYYLSRYVVFIFGS